MTRVLVVDDEHLVGAGIGDVLQRAAVEVVAVATTIPEAVARAVATLPEVVVCDVMFEGRSTGFELPYSLHAAESTAPVVFLSSYGMPYFIQRARETGARGYVLKSAPLEQLVRTIDAAAEGLSIFPALDPRLPSPPSAREREVLALAVMGLSSLQIATELGLSSRTIDGHLFRMSTECGVTGRGALVLKALQMGWVDPVVGAVPGDSRPRPERSTTRVADAKRLRPRSPSAARRWRG